MDTVPEVINISRDSDSAYSDVTKEITDILASIGRKFELLESRWLTNTHHLTRMRTELTAPTTHADDNDRCDSWVAAFARATGTIWVDKLSNTGPKIRFRKQYQCWTREGGTGPVRKELLFDRRRCWATVDLKVPAAVGGVGEREEGKGGSRRRRLGKYVRMGLNVVVKLDFYHLHPVDVHQPFAFFVHNCAPQAEIPQVPQPHLAEIDAELADRIAQIVARGLRAERMDVALQNRDPDCPDDVDESRKDVGKGENHSGYTDPAQNQEKESSALMTCQPITCDSSQVIITISQSQMNTPP